MKPLRFISASALTASFMLVLIVPALGETNAEIRLANAEQVYRGAGPQAALPLFEELSSEFHEGGQEREEAVAVSFIGELHWRLGNYDRAGEFLEQALTLERQAGDQLQEGKTLNILGLLNWDLGDYEQAQAYLGQGAAIAEEFGDRRLAGAILNNLSLVLDELGDYHRSLEQYKQVLELYDGVDFPRGESDTLGNIGGVYLLLGRYREALGYYQQALAISETLNSTSSMSQDHGNIALCHLGLGQVDSALEHLERAIELSAESGMQQDEAYWLRNKGNALIQKGRYDLGLDNHRSALAIYEQLDGKTELIEALNDMGQCAPGWPVPGYYDEPDRTG
jgi:tetratricopeptide (TPR) repeat protein